MAPKFSWVSDSLQNWPPKFLTKRNLTAIPLILISSGIRSIERNLKRVGRQFRMKQFNTNETLSKFAEAYHFPIFVTTRYLEYKQC